MFQTPLDLRVFEPGEWVVLSDLIYQAEPGGPMLTVPRGFITDLASIPRSLRAVFDVNGRSRAAAVLHDYLYCTQPAAGLSRARCDELFREALATCGVGTVERSMMWVGVRAGGWLYWRKRVDGINGDDFVPDHYWE